MNKKYVSNFKIENDTIWCKDEELTREVSSLKNMGKFLDVAETEIYAQCNISNFVNDTSKYSAQGFEVFENSGKKYCLCSMVSNDNVVLSLFDLISGNMVKMKNFTNLGHCNGISYCSKNGKIYIATCGGNVDRGDLVCIDTDLNYIETVTLNNVNPSSVYYDTNEDYFYCESMNTNNIYVFDFNFNILKVMTLAESVGNNVTYQAMSGDSNYLYFVNNGLSYDENLHFNKIDVYTHNMDFIASSMFDNIFELEQIKRLGNDYYFYVNTNNNGYVYIGSIMDGRKMYYSKDSYLSNIRLRTDTKKLWFNSNYSGFLSNGSFEYPINNIYIGSTLYKTRYTRYIYNLIGDFSNYNLNIKGLPYSELQVHGYDTDGSTRKLVQMGGIYLEDMFGFSCDYLNINKRNATNNNAVHIEHVNNAFFGNCVFSAKNVDRMISTISSNVTLRHNTINGTVNNYYFYATEGSYISLESLTIPDDKPSVFRSGVNFVGNNPTINLFKKGVMNNTPFENILYTNYNGAFLGVTQPGTYYFTGSCNVTDLPDNLKKSVVIKVQWVSDSVVQYTLDSIGFTNEYVMAYNANDGTHSRWLKSSRTQV